MKNGAVLGYLALSAFTDPLYRHTILSSTRDFIRFTMNFIQHRIFKTTTATNSWRPSIAAPPSMGKEEWAFVSLDCPLFDGLRAHFLLLNINGFIGMYHVCFMNEKDWLLEHVDLRQGASFILPTERLGLSLVWMEMIERRLLAWELFDPLLPCCHSSSLERIECGMPNVINSAIH